MIIKILSSSKSFSGVRYSELKVMEGAAQLLCANNFHMLTEVADENYYRTVLENTAKMNSRVHNPQFHATISCEGTSYTAEQLKEIGVEYMDKMGFANNPYLIYYHNDTDNNHIHIVSSRVDCVTGKKIDDSFEWLKSQKLLQEILLQNPKEQIKFDLLNLAEYSYENLSQFRLLLEQRGWVIDKDKNIYLRGVKYYRVEDKELTFKNSYLLDGRRKQLFSILEKYSKISDEASFKIKLKEKFGVDIIFYRKNNDKPYGFTVIDNKEKKVYKGGQIINLSRLISNFTVYRDQKGFISELVNKSLSLSGLKEELHAHKAQLRGNFIYLSGEKILAISDEYLSRLKYNDRLCKASLFSVSNLKEARFLSDLLKLELSDIEIKSNTLAERYKSCISNKGKFDSDWRIHRNVDGVFLVDNKTKEIADISNIKIEKSLEADINSIFSAILQVEMTDNPDKKKKKKNIKY